MNAQEIIAKKRDGLELSRDEIQFFIDGLMGGDIADYQAAAWLMAVYLRGMNAAETTHLTEAMARSGRMLEVGKAVPLAVDKHSTGGVGDKTTLVVAPLVVAAGLSVAKISGRGLGFTGGTLDKLESFPGFSSSLSVSRFLKNLAEHHIVVAGQTPDLVPADGRLYAIRDVTATVGSYPLIASSIMSKKLAVGAPSIVLDVKVGRGAFMETEIEAVELAHVMIELAKNLGKRSAAVISDMNQPLGRAVGNSLEVKEAIDTLRGVGPDDFTSHCLTISAQMLLLTGQSESEHEARARLQGLLVSGDALGRFKDLVEAQDGNSASIDDVTLLPRAEVVESVPSPRAGYISRVDARTVGLAAMDLGAGRKKKGDPIDHAVGIVLHKKIGDAVDQGEDLCAIHAQTEVAAQRAQSSILEAYDWQDHAAEPPPLVYRVIR